MPLQLAPRRGRLRYALYWSVLAVIVVTLDYELGPVIQFPAGFVIPVTLAAWYSGLSWALALAVALPLIRLYFTTILDTPWSFTEASINAAIRIGVLGFVATLVDRVALQALALSTRVRQLEGILPVCTTCKRIRDDRQQWQSLDQYVLSESKGPIDHAICPDCTATLSEQARRNDTFERR